MMTNYIEFSFSGVISVDEEKKEDVLKEIAVLVSKFIKNKDIMNFDNKIEIFTDAEIISYTSEVGEA
jgi:hypothetical protein